MQSIRKIGPYFLYSDQIVRVVSKENEPIKNNYKLVLDRFGISDCILNFITNKLEICVGVIL